MKLNNIVTKLWVIMTILVLVVIGIAGAAQILVFSKGRFGTSGVMTLQSGVCGNSLVFHLMHVDPKCLRYVKSQGRGVSLTWLSIFYDPGLLHSHRIFVCRGGHWIAGGRHPGMAEAFPGWMVHFIEAFPGCRLSHWHRGTVFHWLSL